jgi:hypothetical protein
VTEMCCSTTFLQVLVAVHETVWVVDDHGATDQLLPAGCGGVAAMAASPTVCCSAAHSAGASCCA